MTPPRKSRSPAKKKATKTRKPASKGPKARARKGPIGNRFEEAWFRVSTRVRALGFWVQEKGSALAATLGSGKSSRKSSTRKSGRPKARKRQPSKRDSSRDSKLAAGAVALVLVALVLVALFVPLPLVPCGLSPARECPPPDNAIEFVPEDALFYAHLTRDPASEQYRLSGPLGKRIPDFSAVSEAVLGGIVDRETVGIDLGSDVLPIAGAEIAIASVPGIGGSTEPLYLIDRSPGEVGEAAGPALLRKISGAPATGTEVVSGTTVDLYGDGLALARIGDFDLIGTETSVRASAEAASGAGPSLDPEVSPRNQLPTQRFADLYFSEAGVASLLGRSGSALSQLNSLVDYETTRAFALSVSVRDGNVVIDVVSDLSPTRLKANPNPLTEVPGFSASISEIAPRDTFAWLGVGKVGPTLSSVISTALGDTLERRFESLDKGLQREAGPSPLAELLPALRGPAGLIIEPTKGAPDAILVVEDVERARASKALAELQQPLARAFAGKAGVAARFETASVNGVQIHALEGSSALGLTYAITNGRLFVGTSRTGVVKLIQGDGGLDTTQKWIGATGDLPGEPSALLFLDLGELNRLAELAGLAQDPLYAALSDDISNTNSLGVSVKAEPTRLTSRVILDLR